RQRVRTNPDRSWHPMSSFTFLPFGAKVCPSFLPTKACNRTVALSRTNLVDRPLSQLMEGAPAQGKGPNWTEPANTARPCAGPAGSPSWPSVPPKGFRPVTRRVKHAQFEAREACGGRTRHLPADLTTPGHEGEDSVREPPADNGRRGEEKISLLRPMLRRAPATSNADALNAVPANREDLHSMLEIFLGRKIDSGKFDLWSNRFFTLARSLNWSSRAVCNRASWRARTNSQRTSATYACHDGDPAGPAQGRAVLAGSVQLGPLPCAGAPSISGDNGRSTYEVGATQRNSSITCFMEEHHEHMWPPQLPPQYPNVHLRFGRSSSMADPKSNLPWTPSSSALSRPRSQPIGSTWIDQSIGHLATDRDPSATAKSHSSLDAASGYSKDLGFYLYFEWPKEVRHNTLRFVAKYKTDSGDLVSINDFPDLKHLRRFQPRQEPHHGLLRRVPCSGRNTYLEAHNRKYSSRFYINDMDQLFVARKIDYRYKHDPLGVILNALDNYEKVPDDRRNMITDEMMHFLYRQAATAHRDSLPKALFDWILLGRYTGFRRSEWCQTRMFSYQRLDDWPGRQPAEAFIKADFVFLDKRKRRLTTSETRNRNGVRYVKINGATRRERGPRASKKSFSPATQPSPVYAATRRPQHCGTRWLPQQRPGPRADRCVPVQHWTSHLHHRLQCQQPTPPLFSAQSPQDSPR
ncbi:hypothetical protein THAOC_09426, partial [Thalassiosira oceanica]